MTGVELEPGHRRQQQNARLVERALRHGVLPDWRSWTCPLVPGCFATSAGRGGVAFLQGPSARMEAYTVPK